MASRAVRARVVGQKNWPWIRGTSRFLVSWCHPAYQNPETLSRPLRASELAPKVDAFMSIVRETVLKIRNYSGIYAHPYGVRQHLDPPKKCWHAD
jgi:hypothetical protein